MSWPEQLDARSCVLLRLGDRRFALAADQVSELVAPSRMFRFAHHTPEIDGVILRRGRVVPVCDVGEKLIGKRLTSRRYYLISKRRREGTTDWIALPVSGDCELIEAQQMGLEIIAVQSFASTLAPQLLPETDWKGASLLGELAGAGTTTCVLMRLH